MATVDDKQREELLQQASKLAMSDYGIIPLHFEVTPWAFKKGITYRPRIDQYTLATEVMQVGSEPLPACGERSTREASG